MSLLYKKQVVCKRILNLVTIESPLLTAFLTAQFSHYDKLSTEYKWVYLNVLLHLEVRFFCLFFLLEIRTANGFNLNAFEDRLKCL